MEHSMSQSGKPAPLFVMNVTDVDDKILAAAKETGETPIALARRYENDFWRDLDALGCLRPHVVTRVTEHVDSDLIPYIERLVETGMAYSLDDGVYFDVRSYEDKMGHITKYGKLAPSSAASDFFSNDDPTLAETKKKDPRDFVLWKNRKDGEDLFWSSPWGEGRPGWHIECSAMIESVQRQFKDSHQFHVHAGGVDLKFPHHTNEIAQSEAYLHSELSNEWIPHWVHTGHLHIQGLKMSKSLKNFITIQELLEMDTAAKSALSAPGDDFRLWCLGLSGSYRGSATYSRDRIDEARSIRQKIVKFLMDGEAWIQQSGEQAPKKWTTGEHKLYSQGHAAFIMSFEALIGNDQDSQKKFDLDGHAFIDAVVRMAEIGNAHLAKVKPGEGAVEPIQFILNSLQKRLRLVGFTPTTTRIGLDICDGNKNQSNVVGGERRLVEELVLFRAEVRKAALVDAKAGTASKNTKSILKLCDDLRDESLPSIGLELSDAKVEDGNSPSWRFCLPRKPEGNANQKSDDNKRISSLANNNDAVPVEDLFKAGRYEGHFSVFNEQGLPIVHTDGTPVSNAQTKKLLKKREKYMMKIAPN
jgi:cysteinyl-tRNA synthetase